MTVGSFVPGFGPGRYFRPIIPPSPSWLEARWSFDEWACESFTEVSFYSGLTASGIDNCSGLCS